MSDKIKVLLLSDHPLVPSGCGTQSKYLIEGLLATGRYQFVCFGGAIKHPDYRPQKIDPEKWGDDWTVYPVDGYGNKEQLREALRRERPDVLMLFTDPRFFVWVWEMEDEIRKICPIVYWHVWDNDPAPTFNRVFYNSTDHVVALSLKTYGLLQGLGLESDKYSYIPHAVPSEIFHPISDDECVKFKRDNLGPHADKKFLVFWNNRNARRKMTGDVIATFSKFMKKVGPENTALVMHTSVTDQEGQNIVEVAKCFDIEKNLVISEQRVTPDVLNMFYNVCDVTINIANNEGFGLGTLESLMAGTSIIVQMTGGLQFQIGDWWKNLIDFSNQDHLTDIAKEMYGRSNRQNRSWFGVPVFPASRSCTGSQPIPYIYDDRVGHDDVVDALMKMYDVGREQRRTIGQKASVWARETFSLQKMISSWDLILTKYGRDVKSTITSTSFKSHDVL